MAQRQNVEAKARWKADSTPDVTLDATLAPDTLTLSEYRRLHGLDDQGQPPSSTPTSHPGVTFRTDMGTSTSAENGSGPDSPGPSLGQQIADLRAERRRQAVALRHEGQSLREIADKLGVSHVQVRRDLEAQEADMDPIRQLEMRERARRRQMSRGVTVVADTNDDVGRQGDDMLRGLADSRRAHRAGTDPVDDVGQKPPPVDLKQGNRGAAPATGGGPTRDDGLRGLDRARRDILAVPRKMPVQLK
jgi:hypothetical protein